MLLLALACVVPDEVPRLGGQSGSEGSYGPPECEEVSREEVPLDVISGGLDGTPQEALDVAAGGWVGWFDGDFTDAGVLTDAAMDLAYEGGTVELVVQELVYWRDAEGTDEYSSSEEVREPSEQCPTHYEIPASATLQAHEGALDESFALTLIATGPVYPYFEVVLPADSLGGTAASPWDPSETDLHLTAGVDVLYDTVTSLAGSLEWRAPPDPANGRSRQEALGGFALQRE